MYIYKCIYIFTRYFCIYIYRFMCAYIYICMYFIFMYIYIIVTTSFVFLLFKSHKIINYFYRNMLLSFSTKYQTQFKRFFLRMYEIFTYLTII